MSRTARHLRSAPQVDVGVCGVRDGHYTTCNARVTCVDCRAKLATPAWLAKNVRRLRAYAQHLAATRADDHDAEWAGGPT